MTKTYPSAITGESVYVDWDEESATFCVFGLESGHAYASYAAECQAEDEMDRRNGLVVGSR